MALTRIYPFDNPLNYTFPPEIKVENGKVTAAFVDDPGLQFIQNFTDDTGFIYDATKLKFEDGKAKQIDQRPIDSTFYAGYTTDINGNWGNGVLTGTAFGGASVSNGKLDLSYSDIRYVDYDADLNADSQQQGCIRFRIIPNYSGSPASSMYFFTISKITGLGNNQISIFHATGGTLTLLIYDENGVIIVGGSLGPWSPTSGITYEFEINYALTLGETRLFIDGNQFGSTNTSTGVRSSDINLLRIGSNIGASSNSNFKIEDFLAFSAVQHTSNYTPDWSNIYDTIYVESKLQHPQKVYSGRPGDIQEYTDFETIEIGVLKFVRNGLWHNGGSWVSSNSTYAEANTASEILANIDTFPASNTLDIDTIFPDSNTINEIDQVIDTFTGQLYASNKPLIKFNDPVIHDGLISFLADIVETGSDTITFILSKGIDLYWHDGLDWVISNGTLAESNTAAEILANASTFTDGVRVVMYIYAVINSFNGLTTPELSEVTVQYDFAADEKNIIEKCIVWCYESQLQGLIPENKSIIFQQKNEPIKYKDNILLRKEKLEIFPNGENTGLIEVELVETENMVLDENGNEQVYQIFIGQKIYEINVPNIIDKNLLDLLFP